MNFQTFGKRWNAFRAGAFSIFTAMHSVLRNLPLFVANRPKTPLRVACIVAFDTLHRLRHGKWISTAKTDTLAEFLDFAACSNAELDFKMCCPTEACQTRELLARRGLVDLVEDYSTRLNALERTRPTPGGDFAHFAEVADYREDVVRLSLGMMLTITFGEVSLHNAIAATRNAADLNLLFRIVMQCQIIDDLLDYPADLAAELPSFLTGSHTFSEALASTRQAAMHYADDRSLPSTAELLCFTLAHGFTSMLTRLFLFAGWYWHTDVGKRTRAEGNLNMR